MPLARIWPAARGNISVMGGHRRRSHWAWGYEDDLAPGAQLREIAELVAAVTGIALPDNLEAPLPLDPSCVWLGRGFWA